MQLNKYPWEYRTCSISQRTKQHMLQMGKLRFREPKRAFQIRCKAKLRCHFHDFKSGLHQTLQDVVPSLSLPFWPFWLNNYPCLLCSRHVILLSIILTFLGHCIDCSPCYCENKEWKEEPSEVKDMIAHRNVILWWKDWKIRLTKLSCIQ